MVHPIGQAKPVPEDETESPLKDWTMAGSKATVNQEREDKRDIAAGAQKLDRVATERTST